MCVWIGSREFTPTCFPVVENDIITEKKCKGGATVVCDRGFTDERTDHCYYSRMTWTSNVGKCYFLSREMVCPYVSSVLKNACALVPTRTRTTKKWRGPSSAKTGSPKIKRSELVRTSRMIRLRLQVCQKCTSMILAEILLHYYVRTRCLSYNGLLG